MDATKDTVPFATYYELLADYYGTLSELNEARAQIAAKNIEIKYWFDRYVKLAASEWDRREAEFVLTGHVKELVDEALAAPARETE